MLKLHNTLGRSKQEFAPLEKGKVKIYSCGPTVYDYAHIGNLAAYIYADLLRRQLEYLGYEVRQIMNITDVGHLTADDVNQADSGQDKMLKAALREKKSPMEIASFYTEKFFEDVLRVNLMKAHYYPRATAHIQQMIALIEKLILRGMAYEKNGNVFCDVEKFAEYGKLSGKKMDELKIGARLEEHPDKKNPYDFALWLKAPKEHLLKWPSPWSEGYPGWHIECSAMSMEYLGQTFDIHTGGEDHIFPHHENEIAQSEGATGKPYVNYWLHNRFLLVEGQKMSKSKGNYYVMKDVLDRGYDPMVFRLLVLSSHYRSNLNFTWEAMNQAAANWEKISRFVISLREYEKSTSNPQNNFLNELEKFQLEFEAAMNDDLNSPLALSVLYRLITETNKFLGSGSLTSEDTEAVFSLLEKFNKVLGLKISSAEESYSPEIISLLEQRKSARAEKNFPLADEIRKKIEDLGYQLEDGPKGQKLRKVDSL